MTKDTSDYVDEDLFVEITPRYIWETDSTASFNRALESDLTENKITSLLADESITPVDLAKEITNLLLHNANNCNLKSTKKEIKT